jgi:GxxExxY protein
MEEIKNEKLVHKELSYRVMGVLFDVFKELGAGHKEKYYENAIAEGLKSAGISFAQQLYVPLSFNGKVIGKYYLDFLVDSKLVLELKKGDMYSSKKHIEQVISYLKAHHLQLGILAQFTSEGVKYRRIINLR